ncbi:MAG: hypothetical protein K0R59_4297 [Sphingobacterium sp.]|jgi:hypothetical protein|uniref:hypothetical protein n=1 Tax=Sphingobacterium sp. CZ-UAM TaxID=1933868 RepID=UPI000987D201|nr:hypothetical protein [Sphingobacterium sp. CZ-UAM]MDF2519001.1 hypothetical protein [Sphingobacterium sp.]OOG20047.1 hypothetical protein BWD42_09245 [Sphingobacterium sp. CZ-UAM]
MAILQNGPNGPITGKFGSVSAYILNGQNIVRGPKRKRTSPPSESELLNRKKQKVAGKFAGDNSRILDFGYQFLAKKGSRIGAFQLAQRHIFKEAIELDSENNPFVNPEKLVVFAGQLTPLTNCEVSLHGDTIDLKWTSNGQYEDNSYKINLALVGLEGESHLMTSITEVQQGACTLQFKGISRKNCDYHVYVGIWNTLYGDFSNSTYCGVI